MIPRTLIWLLPIPLAAFGGRTEVFQIWIALLSLEALIRRRLSSPRLALLGLAALTTLVAAFTYRRLGGVEGFAAPQLAPEQVLTQAVLGLRRVFVPFDNLVAYWFVRDSLPTQGLSPLLNVFYMAIPARFGLGEFETMAAQLGRFILPWSAKGGTPYTVVGFFHTMLGGPGVLLGMFLLGVFLGRVEVRTTPGTRPDVSTYVLHAFLIGRLYILVWGSVEAALLGYAQFFVVWLVTSAALSHLSARRIRLVYVDRADSRSTGAAAQPDDPA